MNRIQRPPTVLCAGRLYCDLVFTGVPHLPVMGAETFSEELSLHAGGGAFITAATFNTLGWRTALLATLPAPPFDTLVRRDLAAAELDTTLCREASDAAAPQITVALATGGDRAFLSHKAGPAIPDTALPPGSWLHLHIGELRSLQEHPGLTKMARDAGMTVSLDCGWDDELLKKGAEMARLIEEVDVFLPSETEFDLLCNSGLPMEASPLTVVKCSKRGAKALGPKGWIYRSSAPVPVVDATGAGDSFNGGFLASWLMGEPLADCLENGNICGAATVQATGGTGGLVRIGNQLSVGRLGAAK